MGTGQVNKINAATRAKFVNHLLSDIKALELMLEMGIIENDIIRIGAEQELCLVNENWRPAKNANAILKTVDDIHFTNEIARYNLEINLDPLELNGNCFSKMEKELKDLLAKASLAANQHGSRTLLTGILPTISINELSIEFMTPSVRYRLLNDAIRNIRKKDLELHIRGVDELSINHDSILFEACNTSFQLHLQIAPEDFISSYNWAQAISGPILGVSANSPLLLGRELWSETRIALFQQSIDTRSSTYALKDKEARVTFGNSWASGSITDIYKDDIAQYKILLGKNIEKNSLKELKQGNIPKLKALGLHNGTIYRWNRPCYGVGNGKPHIRIENRYLPAGPTVLDEMANFAFWVGLMIGRPKMFNDMANCMDFKDAKANFIKAARTGNESIIQWSGKSITTKELVCKELLPLAYSGLEKAFIPRSEIERYLGVIEQRAKGNTGAKWIVSNYRHLRKQMKKDDALVKITQSIHKNQRTNLPVSDWPLIENDSENNTRASKAQHIMSTQLYTINKNDLAELATSIMLWKNIHHIPIENDAGKLCGLLTWSHMEAYHKEKPENKNLKVYDIMVKEVRTVTPQTRISKVLELMKTHEIGCLPVVQNNALVGIITKNDMNIVK